MYNIFVVKERRREPGTDYSVPEVILRIRKGDDLMETNTTLRKARVPIIATAILILSFAAINFAKAYAIIKKANRK